MRPFEEYFFDARVRRQIVTLAAHQEEIGRNVCTAKRTRHDMATIEWNVVPAAQNFVPTGVGALDAVPSPIVKSTSPTTGLPPVDTNTQFGQTIFPVINYLALQRQIVHEARTTRCHLPYHLSALAR